MEIVLTRVLLGRVLAEAQQALPCECCGLLLGTGSRIEGLQTARNVHPTPNSHFEIDPQALVDAHRAAREGGPEVLGYYHSHPTGSTEPSATDRKQAASDGRIWAIVGRDDVAFWRDGEDGFAALSYSLADR